MRDEVAGALAEIDGALAERPEVDGHRFSVAAKHLSRLRDALAAKQRQEGPMPESRRRLEHVNAVISVVLAAHFPLGSIPWGEVEKAREWLAAIAAEIAA